MLQQGYRALVLADSIASDVRLIESCERNTTLEHDAAAKAHALPPKLAGALLLIRFGYYRGAADEVRAALHGL